MIAFIRGMLGECWDKACIVITSGGLGYELALPAHTFASLPERGQQVEFYTTLVTREDAQELYGFDTFEERQTFEILLSISKVGARTALAILSIYRPDDLRRIVGEENAKALVKVSGIGAKTAQHIFLELKYKLGSRISARELPKAPGVFNDVLAALANLGYAEDECSSLVREILDSEPDLDAGSAIRQTLKAMAARKQ